MSSGEPREDETIETYFRPFVETRLKKAQVNQYAVSMGTNSVTSIREALHQWKGPARMVWGLKDALFGMEMGGMAGPNNAIVDG